MSSPTSPPQRKEGDIVEIPYGMRIIRKDAPKYNLIRRLTSKGKMPEEPDLPEEGDEEEVEIQVGGGEEGDGDGDEVGEIDYADDEVALEGGDGGEEQEQEVNLDDGDGDEGDEGGEEPVRRGKMRYEDDEEWQIEKVPIYTSSAAEELAYKMGLPLEHKKWVKHDVRRQVYETQVVYAGKYRMKVGKRGKLIPVESFKREVAVFDETMAGVLPYPNLTPTKIPINMENPFDQRYTYGDYVEFVKDGTHYAGIVVACVDKRMSVAVDPAGTSSKRRKLIRDTVFVEYDEPTLLKTVKPASVLREYQRRQLSADEIYASAEIPNDMRDLIITNYVKLLADLRNQGASDVPAPIKSAFADNMVLLEPVSWDVYYMREFVKFIRNKHHVSFVAAVDPQNIADAANAIASAEADVKNLINEITSILPNGLTYDVTIDDVLDAIRKVKTVTIFQALCLQELEREKFSGRSDTKGKNLAIFITGLVEKYYRTYPIDVDAIYKNLFDAAISEKLDDYLPNKEDRLEFESMHLDHLKGMYAQFTMRYEEDRLAHEHKRLEISELTVETPAPAILPATTSLDDLTNQVKRFEQLTYAAHGSSVYNYLMHVLMPHVFIEGKLARFAKFFRAKLANGAFAFSGLTGANIAHYLPELAMNKNLSDNDWLDAGQSIGALLHNDMASLVDAYINTLNPTSKMTNTTLSYDTITVVMNKIERLLTDPVNVCRVDTATGVRQVVRNGKYVLDPATNKIALERIPEEDMAICYDAKANAFTCHSTRDLAMQISQGNVINPHTNAPYPEDFIARIKARLGDLAMPAAADPLPERRIVGPTGVLGGFPGGRIIYDPTKFKTIEPTGLKPTRVRHTPPSKATFDTITCMLLLGTMERIALFDKTLIFPVKDEDANDGVGEEEVCITHDNTTKGINVAVLTFYGDQPSSISELTEQMQSVPKTVRRIYVVGLDAKHVSNKDKMIYNERAKKLLTPAGKMLPHQWKTVPKYYRTFYADGHDDEELIDALIDIVVDVEGVVAL